LYENTNGLVRQFFTKGSRFERIANKMVNSVKRLLNRRPRRALDYVTPQEEFFKKLFGMNYVLQG
jgi:IS30 family transposase